MSASAAVAGQREVAPLERARAAPSVDAGRRARRLDDARRGRALRLLDARRGARSAPRTSVAARADDRELLARDVAHRRAEPAGVLEADVGQDLDLGRR